MRWTITLAAIATAAGCGDNRTASDADTVVPIAKICAPGDPFSVLVITRQTYFMHPSNPVAAEAIRAQGEALGWHVEVTGDPIVLADDQLTRTDVIVFSITSGDILDPDQRTLFERFFRSGGGFAGTHSATATEWDWPFYTELTAAEFTTHPPIFDGHAKVEAPRTRASTSCSRSTRGLCPPTTRRSSRSATTRSRGRTSTPAGAGSTTRSATPSSPTAIRCSSA